MKQRTDSLFAHSPALLAALGVSVWLAAGTANALPTTTDVGTDAIAAYTQQAAGDIRPQLRPGTTRPRTLTMHAGETITLPRNANGMISMQAAHAADTTVEWGLPGGVATVEPGIDGTHVYRGNDGFITVQTYDGDLRIATVFDHAGAPGSVLYRLGKQTVAARSDDGGLVLGQLQPSMSAAGHRWAPVLGIARVDAPWAKDAAGKPVATRFDITDGAVIQYIDHDSSRHAYPVVADPRLVFEPLPWVYLSKFETKVASVVEGAASLCGIIGNIPAIGPIAQSLCSSQLQKISREAAVQLAKDRCVAYLFAPPLVVTKGHGGDFCE